MRRAIRLGVVVGLALALAGISASSVFAEEPTPAPEAKEAKTEAPKYTDPCTDFELGAASMEPQMGPEMAIEEDPGAKGHRDWVESIWNSP